MSEGLVKFSSSKKFLQDVMRDGADLAELIPDDDKPAAILEKLRVCVNAGGEMKKYDGRVNLAIGRCLARAAADPEVWKQAGYKNLSAFDKGECEDKGISHGTVWSMKKVAEVFDGMPVENYINGGGVANLVTAAYALPKDASTKQKQEILNNVKLPVAKFKEKIEKQYGMDKGETDYGEVKFQGSRAQSDLVLKFLNDPAAQEYLGTPHPMGMLVALIDSEAMEWSDDRSHGLSPEDETNTGEPIPDDAAAEW